VHARPIPEVPPVISTTLSFKGLMFFSPRTAKQQLKPWGGAP